MANPTEKRFHQLTLAIQKAINSIETPVKEKHVRSTIIGTFQEQSAVTYWMVAIRLPLQDNRIVSWKFCHVTHKLLREGHPACLDDSQRHINMIENLGKLWVHLREGYGRLIHLYCNLLVTKLKFHARNPRFPGNMQLTVDELDAIAENDVNNYFQLCVELFDYMEDILYLQAAVFDSLGNARANSMTASGQCRLAALIPCAQDSSHIYDCSVRLLFRLHAALPPDVLAGHRERFRQQFKKLSSFYKHASSLQYYRNLLTLPVLPANPPNFLLQSDFGTYVTPVVSIPEQPPDEVDAVGSLIDTSDTLSQVSSSTSPEQMVESRSSPAPDPILERDRLIDHLQNELKRMRTEVSQIIQERNTMLGSMRENCTRMESQLRATKNELEEEKQKAEVLLVETPEIKKKLSQTEERAKLLDEKFQKLKSAYTQLREEHITLIRQKAEVDKQTSSLRAAAAQHESAKTMLQQQLNDRMKDVELLQQSASSSEEIEAYKSELTNLRSELEQSRKKEVELEALRASMEALEIDHKTATTELQEKLTVMANDLKEMTENNEKLKQEISEKDVENSKAKEELIVLRQRSGDEYKKVIEEKEDALKQLSELKQQYQQEKEDLLQQNTILEADMGSLKIQLDEARQALKTQTNKLVSCAGETALEVTNGALSAFENSNAQDANKLAAELASKAFEELMKNIRIEGKEEEVAKSAIFAAHNAAKLSAYIMDLSNITTDIELADSLQSSCRELLSSSAQCLAGVAGGALQASACAAARGGVAAAVRAAERAERLASGARCVDDELADMDRAIEAAAGEIEKMLLASRAGDTGIKLEVNEKILDACTTLMAAVKILVQDSRKLQNELGDPKTRQKMYRRNPQWSEGLISASKAVVFAAKLLVSPALASLAHSSRAVAAAAGAVLAAVRGASALVRDQEALDTSALSLTATRRLEMESKVRALELESALDAERARLAALRKRHYQLAQLQENEKVTNGEE